MKRILALIVLRVFSLLLCGRSNHGPNIRNSSGFQRRRGCWRAGPDHQCGYERHTNDANERRGAYLFPSLAIGPYKLR